MARNVCNFKQVIVNEWAGHQVFIMYGEQEKEKCWAWLVADSVVSWEHLCVHGRTVEGFLEGNLLPSSLL